MNICLGAMASDDEKRGSYIRVLREELRTLAEESEKADEETKKYYNAAITKIDTFLGSVARGYYHTWQSLSEFGYQAYYNGYAECLNSIISHLWSKLRNPKTLETAIGYLNARIAKFISEVSDKNSKNAKLSQDKPHYRLVRLDILPQYRTCPTQLEYHGKK